jgi:hypothetical protein
MDHIEKLVMNYGNASFACGEHDIENDSRGYNKLLKVAKRAEKELLDAIAELGKGESR